MSTAAVAEVTADVAASATTVHSRFTSAGLADWWWPQFPDTTYDFDPADGAAFHIATTSGGMGVRGEFLDVAEDFLAFSWVWYDADGEQPGEHVTVSFTAIDDGAATRVRIVQSATRETVHDANVGWSDCLERLEQLYL